MRLQNRSTLNKEHAILARADIGGQEPKNNNSHEKRQNFYEKALELISII